MCPEGLSSWSSGEESTCQYRGHGSIPGPERPHMPRGNEACAQLLSLHAAAAEACALQEEKSPWWEAQASQLERVLEHQWRPSAAKNKTNEEAILKTFI